MARGRVRARLRRTELMQPAALASDQIGLARTVLDLLAHLLEVEARVAMLEAPPVGGDATEPGAGPPLPLPEQEA